MTAEPELKEAVMDVINAIDADLDNAAYDEDLRQDATVDAITYLDKVLCGTIDEEVEDEENPVVKREQLFENDDDVTQEAES